MYKECFTDLIQVMGFPDKAVMYAEVIPQNWELARDSKELLAIAPLR